jgi:hypothetical protein
MEGNVLRLSENKMLREEEECRENYIMFQDSVCWRTTGEGR